MKHAYLIIAHHDFGVLHKQLLLLDAPHNTFFIHVDKRAVDFNAELLTHGIEQATFKFIPRTCIYWGGYNQIQCELDLLRAALPGQFDYYHLLSGADLPIKPEPAIYDFFLKHSGKEFISFRENPNDHPDIRKRYTEYFFNPVVFRRHGFYRKLHAIIETPLMRCGLLSKKQYYEADSFRYGSNWFSITDACARYVMANEPTILKQYKNSYCCDEIFLQTLIYNSPFKNNVFGGTENYDYKYCLRKIDWERGSPYVYRSDDLQELAEADELFLFARKFDSSIDSQIIALIYDRLQKNTVSKKPNDAAVQS